MSPPVSSLWKMILSLISTEQCMLNRYCRNFARDDDVMLTDYSLIRLGDSIHDYLLSRHEHCSTSDTPVKNGVHNVQTNRIIETFKEEGDKLVDNVVCEGIYDLRSI